MTVFSTILGVILVIALIGFAVFQVYGIVRDILDRRKKKRDQAVHGSDGSTENDTNKNGGEQS